MPVLGSGDFESLLGGELPHEVVKTIKAHDWTYDELKGADLHAVVDGLLARIAENNFSIVDGSKDRWVKGWGEARDAFLKSGNPDDLMPKYVRPNGVMRIFGRFAKPRDPDFERNWYKVYQRYIIRTQLAKAETIFEFGCGSGTNIAEICRIFPEKRVIGLDWTQESVDIVNAMARKFGWNCKGALFDFFAPDRNVQMPPGSVVFTFGALEQTGEKWADFLNFLYLRRPDLCVFVEPIYELYNEFNMADYLAMRIHEQRNFMRGLFPALLKAQKEGFIHLCRQKRVHMGSLLLEGYSQMIWRTAR